MSKLDDDLSNSDKPLITQNFNQNNNVVSLGKARGTMKDGSSRSSTTDVSSERKRYCLWMLIFLLGVMGLCNLFLSITIFAVLRMNQRMESMEVIPEENLITFFGKTDLDRLCIWRGICQGYGDEPMAISGDDSGVQINVRNLRDQNHSSVQVYWNGTTVSRVKVLEAKDPRTGTTYFSTNSPNFELPSGVEKIGVKIAETHRVTSPINSSLKFEADRRVTVHGTEGVRMEAKDILWKARTDLFLKSDNGSITLSGKEGILIDLNGVRVVPQDSRSQSGRNQYKVCVCMPQGKLFRVQVPPGNKQVSCAHVSMTPENSPCK
ncbi:uncharacterized protein LOC107218898 isoform X1 [Neodiprion lecontei]|uniref:Beta-sarcoglycan n=1 Tax=Neodiprion lecontei TaxID=441921 RepID=A0A6J0BDJ0_NEOLC|nr:uncharacterized protein LOC107218898 isoform X1 [Neodiprion lecontei]XP_046433051.1 uncharacterized protein LOC124185875 isoform X1 [Neodiprion fabricii]